MATYTSYLNLEKPTTSETFNLLKMNQNWDKIDAGVSALNSNLASKQEELAKDTKLNGTTVTNDDFVRNLPTGIYMVNGEGSYLPFAYGTIVNFRTTGGYGVCIGVHAETGTTYVRHYHQNGWHTNNWVALN